MGWHGDPVVVAGLSLLAGLLLLGIRRVGADHVEPGRRRAAAAAVLVLVVALLSPLASYAEERFGAHMVQHLLLIYLAAPLLALAAPVTLALQAAGPRARQRLNAALHSRPAAVLSHPVLTWSVFAATMYLVHFSTLFDASLRAAWVHGAEHLLFLGAAALFWWPVVRADPVPGRLPWPARLLYLVAAMPYQSMLGLAIYSSDHVLYATYAERLGAEALADQQLAGVLMWLGGDLFMLAAIGVAIAAWMRHETRATARLDARLDRLGV